MELAVVMAIIAILSAGLLAGFAQINRRTLNNASLQLQADLRYAQRRAIIEGRQFGIVFEPPNNRYRIVSSRPERTVRTVQLANGVTITDVSAQRVMFHPHGTPTAGFRVILRQGTDTQRITVTVSGGRIHVFDINLHEYE